VLRKVWDRLTRRSTERAVTREEARERMSPAERRFMDESAEDLQADGFVGTQLGGDPTRLLDEEGPPRR
jgi:hypothetical protein